MAISLEPFLIAAPLLPAALPDFAAAERFFIVAFATEIKVPFSFRPDCVAHHLSPSRISIFPKRVNNVTFSVLHVNRGVHRPLLRTSRLLRLVHELISRR
jgi:hypothetical protein